jgi:hypothetical protein
MAADLQVTRHTLVFDGRNQYLIASINALKLSCTVDRRSHAAQMMLYLLGDHNIIRQIGRS